MEVDTTTDSITVDYPDYSKFGISHEEVKREWLKNPKFKEEYYKPNQIGLEVEVIRCIKGITQAQLAKKTKTKQSAISRFETGDYIPSLKWLHKIVRALDMRLEIKIKNYD